MHLKYIGEVKNSVEELTDENWGNIISEIIINPEYSEGLKNLDHFSHAIIIFFMDKSTFDIDKDLVRKPRGIEKYQEYGIFAQRAKHRPNPLGITTVEIISVENNILKVKGLDAINKTPILDIKPYMNYFDQVNEPKSPFWVDEIMSNYF